MTEKKKLNILIADDEEGLRFSLASILEMEGYFVETVGDGFEALEAVKNNSFDIAFFDIRMPGMTGVEAFKKIKEISPETIVVMMTAYAMNDLIKEAVKEGAFACISKPFEIEDVLNTVKEINSKKTGLIVGAEGTTADSFAETIKSAGFLFVRKNNFEKAKDFIIRRKPEIVCVVEQDIKKDALKELSEKLKDTIFIVVSAEGNGEFEKTENIIYVSSFDKNILAEFLPSSDKMNAVIISEDTIWSDNLKLSLLAKGYNSLCYPSASAFLDGYSFKKCDFVICDLKYSDADGLYSQIAEKYDGVKVICISDIDISSVKPPANSAVFFLQKPFETQELLNLTEKIKRGENE